MPEHTSHDDDGRLPEPDCSTSTSSAEGLRLTAFPLRNGDSMSIIPAPRQRKIFTGLSASAAKRCLPLMLANEAGWLLLNPVAFTVTWNGDEDVGSLHVAYEDRQPATSIVADAFGNGVLSFRIPYLFRTPPGWNLLARGPANYVKDSVAPLEGLVETDWSTSPFTMNWKITRPDTPVEFAAREPICMIVPQRRHDLEKFSPVLKDVRDEPEVHGQLNRWHANRAEQLRRSFLFRNGRLAVDDNQPDALQYLRGLYPDDSPAPEHQTKLVLRPFSDPRSAAESTSRRTR